MHSNLKNFTVSFDYKPNEIVRVTIVIQEDANKDEVIALLKEKMKNEASFEIHNTKLDNYTFTINIRYSLVDSLKDIEGIKEVGITRSVGLHDENSASSIGQQEIEVSKKNFFTETGPKIVMIGILVVLILVLVRKKILKNK